MTFNLVRASIFLLVLSILTACSNGNDRATAPESVTSTPDQVTGIVQGHLTLADGQPIERSTFDCITLTNVGKRAPVATYTGTDGSYTCGGNPGVYSLTVYRSEGNWSTTLDVLAGQTITKDFVIK